MITTEPVIPHDHIISYLKGDIDENLSHEISQVKEKNVFYQLFFEFIDSIKKYSGNKKVQNNLKIVAYDFAAIENFLIDFWTGEIKESESQQFIANLIASPLLYQRLLIKFVAVAMQLSSEDVAELAQVQIKSDETLLAEVYARLKARHIPFTWLAVLKSVPEKIADKLRWLFQTPVRIPRLVVVASVILLCVISSAIIFWLTNSGFEEEFNYADKVPFEYNVSGLRGTTNSTTTPQGAGYFINQFMSGITDYLLHDYAKAVTMFERLDSIAIHFPEGKNNEQLLPYLRDLYFYQGLSYLAISQKNGLAKSIQKHNIELAIKFIARADSLVRKFTLNDNDREIYFLGMCYGIAEEHVLAVSQLKHITPDSRFYPDSQRLLKKWLKNK